MTTTKKPKGRPRRTVNLSTPKKTDLAEEVVTKSQNQPTSVEGSNATKIDKPEYKLTSRLDKDGNPIVADGEDFLNFEFKSWDQISSNKVFPYVVLFILKRYAQTIKDKKLTTSDSDDVKNDADKLLQQIENLISISPKDMAKAQNQRTLLVKAFQLFVIEASKYDDILTLSKEEWESLSERERYLIKPKMLKSTD